MIKPIAIISLISILSACETGQQATAAGSNEQATTSSNGVVAHEAYKCTLVGVTAGTQKQLGGANIADLSPFAFTRMSRRDDANRFGISSANGTTVGVGTKQPDGRWVVRDWRPRDSSGPFVTLVTFQQNKQILISIKTSDTGHATFGGNCEPLS